MPRRDFKCPKCNTVIEVVQTMNDNSDVICKDCNAIMERYFGEKDITLTIRGKGLYRESVTR